MPVISAFRRQRQEGREFKASLAFTGSSMSTSLYSEFRVSQSSIVRLGIKKKNQGKKIGPKT